ncbi:MAG: hypothetical protein WAT70_13565 [Rhizobiaceae bacterium]
MSVQGNTPQPVARWRIILAAVLDFFTAFFVLGYVVGAMTGGNTEEGFQLNGWPALLLFALIAGYFVAGRFVGGTLWQRILKAR